MGLVIARWGLPLAAALLAFLGDAWGRPGGGHSYSGGGHVGGGGNYSGGGGGGSGGGEGGGELIGLLLQLIFQVPQIGVPLTVGIIVLVVWARSRSTADRAADWDSVATLPPPPPPSLDPLRAIDPDFSQVLFEDFAFRLYAAAHRARASAGALAALAPYLAERARTALAERAPQATSVDDIVIGAMHISEIVLPPRQPASDGPGRFLLQADDGKPYYAKVAVTYESNMTAAGVTTYVREQWVFWRQAAVQSRPPRATRAFHCPSCGAPFQTTDDQTCTHCGQIVASGRFDWVVGSVTLHHAEDRPPALGGYAPEVGTHALTIDDPALETVVASLKQEDPTFTRETIGARLALVYAELNAGWTERDLTRARPYVSDGLHDYLRYWIESYRRQGLTNKLEGMTITSWQPCKLVRDRHYDAFTVRLWATGRDYTVDGKGKVVGGRPGANRDYSEYWTLIRGARVRGAPRTDKQCPNCGAELRISMAGTCEFCQVHVTSGEFDWVLSKIEQDESYQG